MHSQTARGAALTLVLCAALSACGSATTTPKRAAVPSRAARATLRQVPLTATPARPRHLAAPALKTEVNVVCAAIRRGAPVALQQPYTAARVRRYAAGATAPSRRTVVSLTRLQRLGDHRPLAALAAAWQQLQDTYGAARLVARDGRHARAIGVQISLREQGVTALARSQGLPACAVAGRLT